MNINIPKRLKSNDFRFILLKEKEKIPIEKNWQTTNNYMFDDPKIIKHEGNLGIVCGFGNLRVLDVDTKEFEEEIKKEIPKTLVVETGSGGKHYYFYSDYDVNHVLLDGKGEFRANNYQIVIPNSIHPSGNKYKVVADNPIGKISADTLKSILEPYLRPDITQNNTETFKDKPKDESRSGREFRECIKLIGQEKTKEEVFKEMNVYAKWSNSPPQYKELTYNKAKIYIEKKAKEKLAEKEKRINELPQPDVLMLIMSRQENEATELVVEKILKDNWIDSIKQDQTSEMWYYDKGIRKPNGESFIKELSRKILEIAYTPQRFNKIKAKIEADTFIEAEEFFAKEQENKDEIPCLNGILNIRTRELTEFTPKKYFFNKINANYNPNAECPNIKRFFSEVLENKEDIKVMFEIFGFSLDKKYFLQTAFMFLGGGENGKGVSNSLHRTFLGLGNYSSIPLNQLTADSFSCCELFGKLINIAGDISNTDLKDSGRFKELTSGTDSVSTKRKFMRDLSFVNYAKLIFSCNDLPRVYDFTQGFWRRWVLLKFPYRFLKQKEYDLIEDKTRIKLADPNMIEKLTTEEELSGLLNMALDGLDRLKTNKQFSDTRTTEQTKDIWIRQSDSFTAYCMDCIIEDMDNYVSKKNLRKDFNKYCRKHNVKGTSDKNIKAVLENIYGVVESRKMMNDGNFDRIWEGINFKLRN